VSAVVDTNILVFDTFEDSDSHAEAVSALNQLKNWILPGVVFDEYVYFMRDNGFTAEETRRKVAEYLLDARTVYRPVELDDVSYAVRGMQTQRDYNDYLIVSVARRLRSPLLTFDRRLGVQAVRLGVDVLRGVGEEE
jgi:predicted nucleic acid-binding protein